MPLRSSLRGRGGLGWQSGFGQECAHDLGPASPLREMFDGMPLLVYTWVIQPWCEKGRAMPREAFQVVPLSASGQTEQACPCMAEVPSPWPDALRACRAWLAENVGSVVLGLHLVDPDGHVFGHVYYTAAESALIPYRVEPGVAVVHCEWVQRRHQGQGYGRQLCKALVSRLEEEGWKGFLVAATDDEAFMHHRHFACRGLRPVERPGPMRLMYRPLRQESIDVQSIPLRIEPRPGIPVEVLVFCGGFCPYEATTALLALQVAREFGGRVVVRQVPLSAENVRAYGASGGVWIAGRRVLPGGAPEEAVRQAIRQALEGV